MLLKQT